MWTTRTLDLWRRSACAERKLPLDQSRPRVCPVEPTDYSDAGPGPWNAPTEPPDGHTSSLASNHVRHRPHLQARRAHRAQGLGTRPIRITPEPRHPDPRASPETPDRAFGLEHRCQTPARLATARERAARRTRRRTRETRENGRSPRRIRSPSSRVRGGDPSGPSGRARALHRPERVGYLSASDNAKSSKFPPANTR